MKTSILVLGIFLCSGKVNAQKNDTTVYLGCSTVRERIDLNVGNGKNNQKPTYNLVFDKCPEFKGSNKALTRYFRILTGKPHVKTSTIYVSFIVEKDGHLSNGKIIRSASTYFNQLALKLIKSSPIWQPGILKGKPVRIGFTLPVRITNS
ncbi:MAG: energy transducer TonB [Mucilaginibacter sp.]|uniref:energy transducer TonB n=1 Tax=Mucilaginibacter sp. TaxID=1882438 RepID=UPI00261962DA|nr:energy transducer TonB [Mucilaginibacter sp.]MDB5004032.1 energy transducer TonB [Mucilaginibacter sp.]